MNQERCDELTTMFNERAPLARTMGMRLSFEDEKPVITLPYDERFDNAAGAIHGGIYATMIDNAGWFAAALVRDPGTWLATSEITVHYLRPSIHTTLRAVGDVIKSGRTQSVAEARVYDDTGKLVGHGVGTFVVGDKPRL